MKNFFKGLVCGIVICLISYTVMVYYGNIQDKRDIHELNRDANEAVKDSLANYNWDSLSIERKAELLELWSREKRK